MYNARIVTDAGKTFRFGYEYGTIFDISPLSGIDVKITTSQGFQQIGETVENQAVGGITRTIKGVFVNKSDSLKKTMLAALPVFTTGKLFFNNDYYFDFVVKKSPEILKTSSGKSTFSMMLQCPDPFWHLTKESSYVIGGYTPAFTLPAKYDAHIFGIKSDTFINCFNEGDTDVPFTLKLFAESDVKNAGIINVVTFQKIRVLKDLIAGDVVTINRNGGRLYVTLTRDGKTTDIIHLLDENSDLFWMGQGDNVLKMTADDGLEYLTASVSFNPSLMGVIDAT